MLAESLPALAASDLPRDRWELIVVDDASSDRTPEVARRHADRVVSLDAPAGGPARARNRGTEVARGEILVFVDADVRVHRDALGRIVDALSEGSGVAAVFGAYDTRPQAAGLVSQYLNLVHHYVHASHPGDAETFWAGLGAVRRAAFLRAGGFDAERYRRPQIEDIELGYRLRSMGCRIVLDPMIQGTHLKRWTLKDLVWNGVRDRGIPWMELLLDRKAGGRGTLNVDTAERVLTALAVLGTTALGAGALASSPLLVAVGALSLLAVPVGNARMLRWLARVRGPWFAAAALPLRLVYYLLNGVAVGVALLRLPLTWIRGKGSAARAPSASPEVVPDEGPRTDPTASPPTR